MTPSRLSRYAFTLRRDATRASAIEYTNRHARYDITLPRGERVTSTTRARCGAERYAAIFFVAARALYAADTYAMPTR